MQIELDCWFDNWASGFVEAHSQQAVNKSWLSIITQKIRNNIQTIEWICLETDTHLLSGQSLYAFLDRFLYWRLSLENIQLFR